MSKLQHGIWKLLYDVDSCNKKVRIMRYPKITSMIDSASRPNLIKQTLQTVKKHMKYSGGIEWVFHEAELYKEKSNECIHIAKYSKIFDKIIGSKPMGQGISIGNVLKECNNKYFIHFEDDHICLRDIPLDDIVFAMEENDDINQIAFNKRGTMGSVSGWKKKEVERSGFKLTTSPHWRYTPAIWRCSFIKPKWVDFSGSDTSHWQINKVLKKPFNKTPDADWIIKNLGTYYWGSIGEPAFVKNIGSGQSNRAKGYKY
jgi:hypothetical protein